MQPKSLMKKSTFAKRRKILILSLIIVLVIGVLAGFTDPFKSDGTIHKAGFGETIVMEKELPGEGTPADYDLISNLQFAAYKLHHASFFRGVSNGVSSADLGISSYNQNIYNERVATGDGIVYAETISSSSLVKNAEQVYADNGIIIYRPAKSVVDGKAVYDNTAYAMSYEDFSAAYGAVPNQLSKYVINEETILGVKDLNAPQTQTQSNGVLASSDEFGFDFYIPENLVRGEDGNYLFELTLDADKSSIYYRNEVRTRGGADQNPKFYSVSLKICIDESWSPLYVTVTENYDIAIPVLGGLNCTSVVTEVFTQINDENGEVPEREFFTPFVEQAKLDGFTPPEIPSGSASPADYLAGAFADYINGTKNLDLSLDIKSDYLSAYNVKASVNIKDLDIQALIGSLYFRYADDRINIKCNDVNGYVESSDLAALSGNADIAALLSALPKLDLDVTQIFGGDMLGRVFENCEMTSDKDVTRIRMPFALDLDVIDQSLGKANIDASIYIREDDKTLQSISGAVEILGQTVKLEAKPLKQAFSAPSTVGAVNLKGAIDFIPDIIKTATSKTLNVSGSIAAQDTTIGVNAYIDTTDGITADAVLSVLGVDLSVKYVNDVIYVKVGNIDARGTANDLPDLLKAIQAISGMDVDALIKTLKTVIPTSLSEYANMLNSLTVTDNELNIGLKFLTAPIDIKLTRGSGKLSGVDLGIDFNKFGIKLNASAELALAYPEPRAVDIPTGTEYITFAQLASLVKSAVPYVQAQGFDVAIKGTAGGQAIDGNAALDISGDEVNACGNITAFGRTIDFAVADGTTYVSSGKLKFKGNAAGIEAIEPAAVELMNSVTTVQTIDVTKLITEALASVKSVTADENGVLYVNVKRDDDISLAISADLVSGLVTINGNAFGYAIDITADIAIADDGVTVVEPQDKDEYIDIAVFAQTLEKAAKIVSAGAFTADMQVNALGQSYTANMSVDFADGALKASLDMQDFGLNATVIGKTAYITYKQINVAGGTDDIPALLTALGDIIPTDILQIIDTVLSGNIDLLGTVNTALSSLTSLACSDGALTAVADFNELSAAVTLALDLSNIELITNVNGEQVKVELTNLTATEERVSAPVGEFAQASEIIKAAEPFIPLALDIISSKAMTVSLGGNINGYTLSTIDGEEVQTKVVTPYSGSVYIGFEHGLQAQAELSVSGVKVVISITDGKIYASIGDSIKIYETLSLDAIYDILLKLDNVKAGIYEKATAIIDAVLSTTLNQIIDAASLYPVQNGFGLALTDIIPSVSSVISLDFVNDDKSSLGLNIQINEDTVQLALTPVYDEHGKLQTLSASGELISLDLGMQAAQVKTVVVNDEADYIPLSLVTEYIAPVFDLVESASDAKYITLDLDAAAELWNGKTTDISGTIAISLDPIAVEANLNLFVGTADTTEVNIRLVGNKVYVDSGNIKLSFDIDADRERIYEVLTHYLDEDHYLMQEVKKLLIGGTSASAFSSISLLIERLGEISTARDTQNAIGLMLSSVGNIAGDSTLKTLIGMFNVLARNGELTVGVNALGMTVNATPHLSYNADGAVISGATATTNLSIGGKAIGLCFEITDYYIGSTAVEITAPTNADEYISLAEFVEAIDNAVSTFTAKHQRVEDGKAFEDITVEVQSFDFDYDIFAVETDADGEAVKDAEGRNKPLVIGGVKAIAKKIFVNNIDGQSALKLSFVHQADENGNPIEGNGKYKLNIEAHIVIDIQTATDDKYNAWSSGNTLPVYLDLYVVNNSDYPNGLAFIDYREKTTDGTGERISIDYRSVLQIVAAVLNIMGLDDKTVGDLVGKENVQKLDTTVFESMDIAGLNDLRVTLKNAVTAANYAKDGAAKLGEAWNTVYTAGSIDGLTAQLETLTEQLTEATELFELAKNAMTGETTEATEQPEPEEQPTDDGKVNGKLFNDIVNGVAFNTVISGAHKILSADIDNAITTQTEGTSNVTVKMTDGAVKNTVEEITVSGLDVNTARLNTFALPFDAGEEVTISLPADHNQSKGKADYSDISKIKHLLYDVMNTAGMLEFDIGDTSTNKSNTDKINISILGILNINVRLNAKVKIMNKTEYLPLLTEEEKAELSANNNGKLPQFMTAAAITINNTGNTGTIYDCQTQLYFFNNKIYISGYHVSKAFFIGTKAVTAVYTLDDMSDLMKNTDNLMDKFVYYLMPLSNTLQSTVKKEIKKDYSSGATPKTFANVFKGYSYDNNEHTIKVGLQELAQNTMLGDAEIKLTGAYNDDDDAGIVTNNYVSKLTATLKVASVVNITINETLRNVNPDETTQTISSSGLGNITVQNVGSLGTYDFVTTIGQIKNYTGWTPYSSL